MKLKTLALVGLASLTLTACGGVDPDSPLGKRQVIFKRMLKTSEDLGGMLRGRIAFDDRRFVAGAAELDQLARQPWQHFPQAKEDQGSSARDELWQRQERFQQLARELESATAALVALSPAPPLDRTQLAPAMQRVEDGCEACHQEFRAY